jgi:hypothetical protein
MSRMSYKCLIKKTKLPINDRKDTKILFVGMGQKGQRLGNSGASWAMVGQSVVNMVNY